MAVFTVCSQSNDSYLIITSKVAEERNFQTEVWTHCRDDDLTLWSNNLKIELFDQNGHYDWRGEKRFGLGRRGAPTRRSGRRNVQFTKLYHVGKLNCSISADFHTFSLHLFQLTLSIKQVMLLFPNRSDVIITCLDVGSRDANFPFLFPIWKCGHRTDFVGR